MLGLSNGVNYHFIYVAIYCKIFKYHYIKYLSFSKG